MPNSASDDENDSVISIPVSKKDLGGFICDLLGQKQSLERTYDVEFEIDHSWLMNLHEMIDQRISQQANSHLINFNAVVYFDNGTKRTITTIEAFRAYHETKPEVSNGVKIVWEYLVLFPKRPHPEKQQISFTASVFEHKVSERKMFLDIFSERLAFSGKESLINIQIDHTERTWGDDIENIISSCVQEATKTVSLGFIVTQISRLIMTLAIFIFMFFYPLYHAFVSTGESLEFIQQEFLKLKEVQDITTELLNQKVELIFDAVTKIEHSKNSGTVWLLISAFVGPFVTLLFLAITRSTQQSHVLLSSKAKQQQEKFQRRNKNRAAVIALSYIASIAAGIIGNYGFQFLTS